MSLFALVIALLAIVAAVALAAADGAVIALDAEPGGTAPRGVPGIADRERAHRALAFARMIAHLVIGATIADTTRLEHPFTFGALVASLVAILAVITLVEGGARAAGATLREHALIPLAPVVRFVERLLALPLQLAARLDRELQRVLPPPEDAEASREEASEQFRRVVAAEAEEAGVTPREAALLRGAFELGDTEVREIMVPRVDIIGIDLDTPWSEVVDRVRSSQHARFPVYRDTLDDVQGILYAKDLLLAVIRDEPPAEGWQRIVRPAAFVPPSKPVAELLRAFQSTRTHIAVVIDEFGGTAGMLTIEDILEEIVGEIRDEHDVEEQEVVQEEGTRFWVDGRVGLDQLSELLEADFVTGDATTVGGLVYTLLGRVPRNGEELQHLDYRIVVERVRRRRIERVYFERLERSAGEEE
ncbi:MAG: hemolysin family protein [Gemmatimonadaceae bacterium]